MKHYYSSVVELRQPFRGTFETYPYETGWASEAIFFVHLEPTAGPAGDLADEPYDSVDLRVQISPDGLRWLDEGTSATVSPADGSCFLRVRHFGGFLRLAGAVRGSGDSQPSAAGPVHTDGRPAHAVHGRSAAAHDADALPAVLTVRLSLKE